MHTLQHRRRALYGLVALFVLTALATTAVARSDASTARGSRHSELTREQRNEIRHATTKYKNAQAAIADGYTPSDRCDELIGVGASGYRYVNDKLVRDGVIEPDKPEALIYHLNWYGKLELGAVEYIATDADQNSATTNDRPSLYRHPLHGPSPATDSGLPVRYHLHAWVHTNNPDGTLAPWNPHISCAGPRNRF